MFWGSLKQWNPCGFIAGLISVFQGSSKCWGVCGVVVGLISVRATADGVAVGSDAQAQ